jgi:hypothetical protein
MTEFIVTRWSVTRGCIEQHEESVKEIMDYLRKNAERFKLKSLRYFSQMMVGDSSIYYRVMIYEYDSIKDMELFHKEMQEDETAKRLKNQLFANINLKSRKTERWKDKQKDLWF